MFSFGTKESTPPPTKPPNPLAVCLVRVNSTPDFDERIHFARQTLSQVHNVHYTDCTPWTRAQLCQLLERLARQGTITTDKEADESALKSTHVILSSFWTQHFRRSIPMSDLDSLELAAADPRADVLRLFLLNRALLPKYSGESSSSLGMGTQKPVPPHPEAERTDELAVATAIRTAQNFGLSERATALLALIYCTMRSPTCDYARQVEIEKHWLAHTATLSSQKARFHANQYMFTLLWNGGRHASVMESGSAGF
jgi:hypothetical protein